ncbi:MAG: hypothetical protein IPH12_09475 [Saprospirales bacterium]|nr:hypothetical protein [Saprospirales bacterium]MBK8921060.1 hypothetical protein [Saprospirales bacterium]
MFLFNFALGVRCLQLRFANRVDNWARFFTRILIRDIPGRREAKRIEREHIKAYKDKNGRRPRWNLTVG